MQPLFPARSTSTYDDNRGHIKIFFNMTSFNILTENKGLQNILFTLTYLTQLYTNFPKDLDS